ncbi:CopD family protein [Qipengyuania thermophila]|uniref:CopD family protein n=1 Tax=Qipengyuania thermophila TaxID=2509361 RepID=UPI0018F8938B|nr:CopD family protein [Qipengyuania thermophila]
MIAILKALHIAALVIWSAGLIALPTLLVQHAHVRTQEEFGALRYFVRRIYVRAVTPAAIVAVVAGTALIFARDVFTGWMYLKLAVVALMVALHAFQGHLLLEYADHRPAMGWLGAGALMTAAVTVIALILALVLAKPPLDGGALPDWLLEPRGQPFPGSAETPI